jgi:intracellular septation protein
MKLLFDFFPLILFFAAFKLYGIYAATFAAIAASVIQVAVFWYRERRFEATHLVTLAVIAVFGGLTIVLHDVTFIKWKPTIVNWIFAAILLGSQWLASRPAIQLLLGSKMSLPAAVWRMLNLSWALFFVAMGALNLYVAFYYRLELDEQTRTDIWVNFKVFWMMGLTLVFAVGQSLLIARHIDDPQPDDS